MINSVRVILHQTIVVPLVGWTGSQRALENQRHEPKSTIALRIFIRSPSSAEQADTLIAAAAISIRVAPAYGKPLQVVGSSANSASRRSAAGAGTTCCRARRAVARLPFG